MAAGAGVPRDVATLGGSSDGLPSTVAGVVTRSEQQAQTRAEILDAAHAEIAQRGVADVTLDAVAARAGFTKGAIYSNFDSKIDLLFAVLQRHRVQVGSQYIAAAAKVPDDELGVKVSAVASQSQFHDIVHQRVLVALWSAAMGDPAVADRLAELRQTHRDGIAAAIRDRAKGYGLELGVDVDNLALGLTGMSMSVLFDAAIKPEIDTGAAHQTMIDIVLAGVRALSTPA